MPMWHRKRLLSLTALCDLLGVAHDARFAHQRDQHVNVAQEAVTGIFLLTLIFQFRLDLHEFHERRPVARQGAIAQETGQVHGPAIFFGPDARGAHHQAGAVQGL